MVQYTTAQNVLSVTSNSYLNLMLKIFAGELLDMYGPSSVSGGY